MLKITVFLGISLDGYIAGLNGDLEWLNMGWLINQDDLPEDSGFYALLSRIDCMIMGRNTYDAVLSFGQWPYKGKRVVILSSREGKSVYGETFYSGPLTDLIDRLQSEGIKGIYLDGGQAIRQGLESQLVDEMTLSWIPIILGGGIPLFDDTLSMSQWRLASSRAFPSGLLQATYISSNR